MSVESQNLHSSMSFLILFTLDLIFMLKISIFQWLISRIISITRKNFFCSRKSANWTTIVIQSTYSLYFSNSSRLSFFSTLIDCQSICPQFYSIENSHEQFTNKINCWKIFCFAAKRSLSQKRKKETMCLRTSAIWMRFSTFLGQLCMRLPRWKDDCEVEKVRTEKKKFM